MNCIPLSAAELALQARLLQLPAALSMDLRLSAHEAALTILSLLTTLFFISPWAVLRGTPSLRRVSAWVAAAAFLFNAHWYIRLRPARWISDLGIGYFLWWLSFLVLAIGLFDLAGRNNAAESTQPQAALLPG